MQFKFLITLSVFSMLGACSWLTKPSASEPEFPPIDEALLMECEAPSRLIDGKHQTLETWAVIQGRKTQDCAARQKALAETVRLRQKLTHPDEE